MTETALIFLGVLGSLKLLHEFRSLPFLNQYLSTIAALVLIYPPVIHVTLRKIQIAFFEKNLTSVVSSLFLFVAAGLIVIPPFLGLNHLYQQIFLGRSLGPLAFDIPTQAIFTQLFLIAFPEEFFFRGYLQTVISRSFHHKIRLFGLKALTLSWAIPITSLVFAASHSFITFQWWHFAIFFPSLAFGWLREKTNGLVAPILFHALSNILVNWIGTVYR